MTSNTTLRSWSAIGLGTLAASITAFVLLQDVVYGAPITTAHLATAGALIFTIAAGHFLWPMARQGKVLPAFGLLVLFLTGTFYIVTSSAGRNAEVQTTKNAAIKQRNAERADLDAQIVEARKRHQQTQDAQARECGTGKGVRCEGWKTTVEAHASHVALLEARRRIMGGVERENAGYAHAAQVYAALLGGDPAKVETVLTLTMPFALVLICEWAALVFFTMGLGHGGPTGGHKAPVDDVPEVPEIEDPNAKVIDWTKRFAQKNGRPPKLNELEAQFPEVARTTLYRRKLQAIA